MIKAFPKDRLEKRKMLLDGVERIAETLRASGPKSEELGTLAPEAVTALRENGMFRLKLCAEMGGAEADPVTEMLVLEGLAYNDLTSGWCTMVGATGIASLGTFLTNLGSTRYSPTARFRPRQFRSFRPAARCATARISNSAAAGASTAAFSTANGSSAAPSSKAAKPKTAAAQLSCSPRFRNRKPHCTTIGAASSACAAPARATARSKTWRA